MKIIVSLVFFVSLFVFEYHDASAISSLADCPDGGTGYTLVKGVCVPSATSTGLSDAAPHEIITNVINWLMEMIGIVAMIMFVISGWMYLMAGGDEKKIEIAKSNIIYTITGLVIALAAFIIVKLVANIVGIDI